MVVRPAREVSWFGTRHIRHFLVSEQRTSDGDSTDRILRACVAYPLEFKSYDDCGMVCGCRSCIRNFCAIQNHLPSAACETLGRCGWRECGIAIFTGTNRELALGISIHVFLYSIHHRRCSCRRLPWWPYAMDS